MLILLSNSVVQQQRHSLDDEEEIIGFEDTDIQAGIDKCSRSLMGRIMVVRLFSAETIKSALYAFWRQLEAYSPLNQPSIHQRLFSGVDNIYCVFLGSLHNLSMLNKQYGLSKGTNEAMFIFEAYRTLRDRGPYHADQVLKELEGSFGFVIYDNKDGTVFVASGSNGQIGLYWGIAVDGSVVVSEDLELIKASCAKSFAPFPTGMQI
ncbi:hypothetical protein AHAS_Ahas12G0199700 [Arachis hypogaea]